VSAEEPSTYEEQLQRQRAYHDGLIAEGWTVLEVVEHISEVLCTTDSSEYAKYTPPFYVEALRAERARLQAGLA
jgi:hypothetical protein